MGLPQKIIQSEFFLLLAFLFVQLSSHAQIIYGATGYPTQTLWTIEINGCSCNLNEIGPLETSTGVEVWPEGGIAICPDGSMYLSDLGELFFVDPTTGLCTSVPGMPNVGQNLGGLACAGNGILYGAVDVNSGSYTLYQYDLINVTVTSLGILPFPANFGMFFLNDELYMLAPQGLVLVDTIAPENSMLVLSTPLGFQSGGTIYGSCNALLILTENSNFALMSLIDGSIVELCNIDPIWWMAMTTQSQFLPSEPCTLLLDLDCNDSSGADGADFNSPVFTCLTPSGVPIGDDDIVIFGDALMDQMTVTISPAFMPDGADEILDVNMPTPGLDVTGFGSSTLTFTNSSGTATFNDFIDALHATVYINTSPQFTPGIRSIEVEYTNIEGDASELATAFIEVEVLPLIPVDLGDDLVICDGETATFNAGNPGSTYLWSTQQTTQSITTDETGEYSVTVSNGIHCPNSDTAFLEVLPVIDITLIGDSVICDNEIANLTILVNTIVPVTIEIESTSGATFVFTDLLGDHSFTDSPTEYTEYTIVNIVPSSPACLYIIDPAQGVEVYPTFYTSVDTSICEGDSVWLGTYWQTMPGTYGSTYASINGCDSIVTTFIEILPEVMISVALDTCDPSAAGVFITYLENPDGCDTIVQTTITLLPVITTYIDLTTCKSSNAGVVIDTFSNPTGCDSLLITTTTYIPPADTTYLNSMSCDSAMLGIFYDTLSNIIGCDSIISLSVSHFPIDTTHISGYSCIPGEIGVFAVTYTDPQGCDSIVIRTILPGEPDTTRIFGTSCDPGSIGIFETLLVSSVGCDSLIISTITFSAQDSTFISSSTCDQSSAGVFVSLFTNQFGCDSIVTETVVLNISHQIEITSSSCFPADTGVFIQNLTNQFGCDSIVTENITLLPSDETQIHQTTCDPSEAGMFITAHFNQFGCDSIVSLTVTLVAADTTHLNYSTCDPGEIGIVENLYAGQDGCDSLVIETTSLFPLPALTVESAIDYNGFDISCAGEADGSVLANVIGVLPYAYIWSTNDTTQMITGVSAGAYSVAITDGNGCMTTGAVTLMEPELFMIGFEVSEPDCFDQALGTITVQPNGGVSPYTYSIDGTTFQHSPVFAGLSDGIYQVTSLDANDCTATEIISIDVPLMVEVDLGNDQMIQLGDSALLQAIVNLPFDSISSLLWTGIENNQCPNCTTQLVAPIITTAYAVAVTSTDGCSDRDSVLVSVSTDHTIFIPNIFSPNGDGINDLLTVSIGEGIKEITVFSIFDRWGNLVFDAQNVLPVDPSLSWDGKWRGTSMNPGVFTYKAVILYAGGKSEVRYGDVTLVR